MLRLQRTGESGSPVNRTVGKITPKPRTELAVGSAA
jgi:hypothetical protein